MIVGVSERYKGSGLGRERERWMSRNVTCSVFRAKDQSVRAIPVTDLDPAEILFPLFDISILVSFPFLLSSP